MKVAVFGGRFDPPHIGHYWVIRQVLDFRRDIEKVILVPSYQHQWKDAVAMGEERLEMLSTFTSEHIEVSDIELQRRGVSYSIDTIKALKEKEHSDITWILGSDILSEFDRWEKAQELVKEATFLIFPRDPYHLPEKIPQGFEVLSDHRLITSNLSSTVIKRRRKQGMSLKGFVLPEVEEYILEHELYK
ncbi:MAG: nicotinate (nicotinamide) nucleotide adenylyltransferase [Candidatus Levybacteria bacterium]|nr:nicotinate (nicotinamide) nucleotide adenylyltransferase [Candidatus Levybacteria bacterium]